MRFHNQMIRKEYDHTAQILYKLNDENDVEKIQWLGSDKDFLCNAVLNDYRYRCIAMNQMDFFYDNRIYESIFSKFVIDLMMNTGMSEQNIVLYNVNTIIDRLTQYIRVTLINQKMLCNIGFLVIDVLNQQLCITDIINQVSIRYAIMTERDMNQVFGAGTNNLKYLVRFRFLGKQYD